MTSSGATTRGRSLSKPRKAHESCTFIRRPFSPCLQMAKTRSCGAAMAGWLVCGRWEWQPAGAVWTHQHQPRQNPAFLAAHPSGTMATGVREANGGQSPFRTLHACPRTRPKPLLGPHLEAKNVVLSGGQDGQLQVQRDDESLLTLDVHQSAIYRGLIHGSTCFGRAVGTRRRQGMEPRLPRCLEQLQTSHTRSVNAMTVGRT